jgi:hypothetical protein
LFGTTSLTQVLAGYDARMLKSIPATGCGGHKGCETSRLPYFLENCLTDGGEVVSLTRRPSFTPREIRPTQFC